MPETRNIDPKPIELSIAVRRVARTVIAALICILPLEVPAQTPMTPEYLDHYDGQKKTLTLENGQLVAYLDVGPRDAQPVVLIHGYTDSARDWAPLARELAAFRLIVVDLRGHGASGKPECCYTRFDFAYDIKLLLSTLRVANADIVGHSLGSIVAQTYAELWPEATRRLVLISSTGLSFGTAGNPCSFTISDPARADWMAGIAALKDPIDPDSRFMHDWWQISISVNPAFFSTRQRRDAAAIPADVWRAIADQSLVDVDLRSMLPRIQAPTLLVWGGQDTLFSDAARETLSRGIANAEVRVFESLGHDLFWEGPREVAEVLIDFLEPQPAASRSARAGTSAAR